MQPRNFTQRPDLARRASASGHTERGIGELQSKAAKAIAMLARKAGQPRSAAYFSIKVEAEGDGYVITAAQKTNSESKASADAESIALFMAALVEQLPGGRAVGNGVHFKKLTELSSLLDKMTRAREAH